MALCVVRRQQRDLLIGHFETVDPVANDVQLADTSQSTFVYTAGHSVASGSKGKFFHGAYGVHWPDKPELNKSVRITAMPTPTRCQLNAIVTALEQVKMSNELATVMLCSCRQPQVA